MCLAVPGQVVAIDASDGLLRMATVDFGGISREVCLAYVDAGPGDWVLVHVGFAISRISEADSERMLDELDRLGDILESEP